MYCPECSGEYREGFTHCADCDVDLVESLPASPEGTSAELVTVLETSDPAELAFVESLLRSAGIPFFNGGITCRACSPWGRSAGLTPWPVR